MSKVYLEDSTLTSIADAIRVKTGGSASITPANMPSEIESISGGGGGKIQLQKFGAYWNYNRIWSWLLNDLTKVEYPEYFSIQINNQTALPFFGSTIQDKTIFDNVRLSRDLSNTINYDLMLSSMTQSGNLQYFDLSILDAPIIKSSVGECTLDYAYGMGWFYSNPLLEEIQDYDFVTDLEDFLAEDPKVKLDMSAANWYNRSFCECYSLKKIPESWYNLFKLIFSKTTDRINQGTNFSLFLNARNMKTIKIPILGIGGTITAREWGKVEHILFEDVNSEFQNRIVFNMKTTVGYTTIQGNNSTLGIKFPDDKRITDDATYAALKDDPDSWTSLIQYSKYNHNSAVETIGTLPDLTTLSKTGTIQWSSNCGSSTDEGGIGTLTAEEIAVATDKGWTISLS